MTSLVSTRGPRSARRARGGAALRFILIRLASSVVVLLLASFAIFMFVHAAPGGPEQAIGGPFATPEQRQTIREDYRLDDPLLVQYGRFVSSVLTFDLGTSLTTRESVASSVGRAVGTTFPLIVAAWAIAGVLGTTLGVLTAHRPGTKLDRAALVCTTVLASSPVFVTGLVLGWIFGVQLGWLPTVGSGRGGLDTLTHLILPATTLGLLALASTTRLSRVRIGQVLREDHVTFSRARGLSTSRIVRRTLLPNSGVQLVTQAGAVLISMMGAVIVVEEIFGLDGVGTLLVNAIAARDIPVVQSVTLLLAVVLIVVNIVVDVVCLAIDPRIRLEARR